MCFVELRLKQYLCRVATHKAMLQSVNYMSDLEKSVKKTVSLWVKLLKPSRWGVAVKKACLQILGQNWNALLFLKEKWATYPITPHAQNVHYLVRNSERRKPDSLIPVYSSLHKLGKQEVGCYCKSNRKKKKKRKLYHLPSGYIVMCC